MNGMRTARVKALVFLAALGVALLAAPVFAEGASRAGNAHLKPSSAAQKLTEPNSDCLMCHSDPDFKGYFEDGSSISLYVDAGEYRQSVHEPAGLDCVACHTVISRYPHHEEQVTCLDCHEADGGEADGYASLRVSLAYQDAREMIIEINAECRSCHEEEFEIAADSAHEKAQNSGNRDAPICVDCHGGHHITPPREPREKISQTCSACHKAVYSTYRSSIHGAALEADSNPDVPTCVECHGVHEVRGPRDPSFRNDSIQICGSCHSDASLMQKYDISADVFQTYLDDFHGRTVDLFQRFKSDLPSNKATCFDCHGIHNIRSPDDPISTVYPDNLQHTCQQCHPEASIRFPQAWLSHYIPTYEDTPALYVVNRVYPILIYSTIGGFVFYIGLDVRKRWSDRRAAIREALTENFRDDIENF